MRFTLLAAGAALSLELAAPAEMVNCGPGGSPGTEFEVLGEKLPSADYLTSMQNCLAHLAYKPAPPTSPWLDSQRAVYRKALARQAVDVLVAPFQNQGYGLERTERTVMSADLAYHLGRGVRVADPFLTARALGEGARTYDRAEIVALAQAVGATTRSSATWDTTSNTV